MLGEEPVEEGGVAVLERGQADVALERVVLAPEVLELELDLLLDGQDAVREQAAQPERVALLLAEREVLGQQAAAEQCRAGQRDGAGRPAAMSSNGAGRGRIPARIASRRRAPLVRRRPAVGHAGESDRPHAVSYDFVVRNRRTLAAGQRASLATYASAMTIEPAREPLPPGFRWPDGIRAAAFFSFDMDAEAAMLADHPEVADYLDVIAHQRYGPQVAVPRILRMLDRVGLRTTFFIPGWVAETWPDSPAASATPATRSATTATCHESRPRRGRGHRDRLP